MDVPEFLQNLNAGQVRDMKWRPRQDRERLRLADELRMRGVLGNREFSLRAAAKHGGGNPAEIEEELARAPRMFYTHLYDLVLKWIRSGHIDGQDFPRQRTLQDHPEIRQALAEWRLAYREVAAMAPTGEELRQVGQYQRIDGKSLDARPREKMQHEAIGFFYSLMNSGDFRYRLNRCHACNGFYARKKLRPSYVLISEVDGIKKDPGYAGTSGYCQDCLKSASDRQTNRKIRSKLRSPKIEVATKALYAYSRFSPKTRERYGSESAYIVKKLERFELPHPEKWVARNLAEIKRRATER